jgi:hypothetical protein
MAHPSFDAFYHDAVLPRKRANPQHIRLDGKRTGGNWDVAGEFMHRGELWRVHADSHYEPLRIAHEALHLEGGAEPFVVEHTKRGRCLALRPDLRERYPSRYKHLYIYSG